MININQLYTSFWVMGDLSAFKEMMRAFTPSLKYFAYSIVGNEEEAEEIVADVFIKVWEQRQQVACPQNVRYYLFKAVKNTALNYLKSQGRREAHHAAWEIQVNRHHHRNPEDIMISKEHLDLIQAAIRSLPPRCRQIFILVKEEGLSYEEVATLLDISKATVNVQMTLALKKMWLSLGTTLLYSYS